MFRVGFIFAAALLVISSSASTAQDSSSLFAERSIDWRTGRPQDVKAQVGPIRIHTVEFSDQGKGGGRRLPGMPGSSDSEASTTIRSQFQAENPTSDEWEVTFTLEFLDKGGAIIDKVTKKASWEGEAKAYNLDHSLLTYVVPAISRVRITMRGRLD